MPQIVLDFIPLEWVIWSLPCSDLVLSRSNGLFESNVWLSRTCSSSLSEVQSWWNSTLNFKQPHSIYPVSFHRIVLAWILYSGIVDCMLSVRAHVLDCLVMKERVRARKERERERGGECVWHTLLCLSRGSGPLHSPWTAGWLQSMVQWMARWRQQGPPDCWCSDPTTCIEQDNVLITILPDNEGHSAVKYSMLVFMVAWCMQVHVSHSSKYTNRRQINRTVR